MLYVRIGLMLSVALTLQSYAQQVYKCTDASGVITYSDHACGDNPEVIDVPQPNTVPSFRSPQRPTEAAPVPNYDVPLPPGAYRARKEPICWEDLNYQLLNAQDAFQRLVRESDFDRALRLAKNLSYDLEGVAFAAMTCDCILASGEFDQAAWDLRKASREEDSVEDFIRYLKRAASSFDSAVMLTSRC